MNFTRTTLVLAATTLAATTVLAQKTTSESAPGADLQSYKTFMWIKQPNLTDPILRQTVVSDINAELTAKGYRLVSDGAELGLAAHLSTSTQKTLSTFYDGFGGGWRWAEGFGSATTTVDTYQEGTLVVDLFDARTKQAVWRGSAEQETSSDPRKETESMARAVEKMFKKFPA
jgi:hypothetical protein